MENCILTQEMLDFFFRLIPLLGELPKAIRKPEQKWWEKCVNDFQTMRFDDRTDLRAELRGMFCMLDRYSMPGTFGDSELEDKFHALRCELRVLHHSEKIFQQITSPSSIVSMLPVKMHRSVSKKVHR